MDGFQRLNTFRNTLLEIHDEGTRDFHWFVAELYVAAAKDAGEVGDIEAMELWLKKMAALTRQYIDDEDILYVHAVGIFNAVTYASRHKHWSQVDFYGEQLHKIALKSLRDDHLDLFGKAVANAAIAFTEESRCDSMILWGNWLKELSDKRIDHLGTKIKLSQFAVHALLLGLQEHSGCFDAWKTSLFTVAEENPSVPRIQLSLAQAAANAMVHHQKMGWTELSEWGDVLRSIAKLHPDNVDIQLVTATGSTRIFLYWCKQLSSSHEEIANEFARCVAREMCRAGALSHVNDLECWSTDILTAGSRFPEHREIQKAIVVAAGYALRISAILGLHEFGYTWFERVREIQIRFQDDRDVQEFVAEALP